MDEQDDQAGRGVSTGTSTRITSGVSIWAVPPSAPGPDELIAPRPRPTAPGLRPVAVVAPRALSERLVDAQLRRAAVGWRVAGDGAEPVAGTVRDEMLQLVVELDDRSLMSKGVVAGPASAGPLPRRRDPEPMPTMLPRRTAGPGATDVAPVVVTAPDACPDCGGGRLRVDQLDLDAATCVRTCADCDTTFTSTI